MAAFPTVWELLIPNFNIWTILGIATILLAILVMRVSALAKIAGFDLSKYSWMMILAGIFMIWGISIIQDFLDSTGGMIVFWGSIVVLIVGILLFYNPKKRGKKR